MIQRLRALSGWERRLCLGLAWLAVALYALAPAVPQAAMPAFMAMPAMTMADDCPMDMASHHGAPDQQSAADQKATHDCPICKMAATAVLLAAPPALPVLAAPERTALVPSPWLQPSQRVSAAQPRGPPAQI